MAVMLTVAVMVPLGGASTAAAAPASLVTAFRDLPLTVRTGDIMKVQVDAPNQARCEGNILYRDNSIQKLAEVKESDGRCRWDITVPDISRRGEADVTVTVKDAEEQATITATVMVVRRSDSTGITLKELPGSAKRDGRFTVNLEVPDNATCFGQITYTDGKTQNLDSQPEYKERCRWEVSVPSDVTRGTARGIVDVTHEGRSTKLSFSFDVDRDSEKAKVLAAFQDLPASVRRDGTLTIKALVPGGARCTGDVEFRSADNVKLEDAQEQSGACYWSVVVPNDAKRDESRVKVTVKADGKETVVDAYFNVEGESSDVKAEFKDLPNNISRGDNLDIRVTLPDAATCHGVVTFDDGTNLTLEAKTEKKDRCLWSVKVPNYIPRGTAVVRVWIDDHGVQTSLTGNVTVEGRGSEPIATSWEKIPTSAKLDEEFTVEVNATSGSSCSGKIDFADGMRWTLGTTEATDSRCRWKVQVPKHVTPGKAKAEVKIVKGGGTDTIKAEIEIKNP